MKKTLTEEQYQDAVSGLDVGTQTLEIAYGVLVLGQTQKSFVEALGVTKGAVSQAVLRIWESHQSKSVPKGYEKVTAILPEHQAFQVKIWSEKAKKNLKE